VSDPKSPPSPDSEAPRRRSRVPSPTYNPITFIGVALAAGGLTGVAFFIFVSWLGNGGSGYVGLTFVPPLVLALLGVALMPVGRRLERRRREKGSLPSFSRNWSFDLTRLVHGRGLLALIGGTIAGTLGILVAGAGSLKMVEFTESNTFCGQVCHAVMHPEAVVYEESPHARIDCVECHVGHGGDSYIRSKLSGMRQLWAVASGSYSRPIPTPIAHRRPSREMCETCHWPDRFIDYKTITRTYYLSDPENTPVELRMMVKVGGAGNGFLEGSGIHFHMLSAHKVEFIARDSSRQEIPWVRITHPDGEVEVYQNDLDPPTEEELETREVHVMQCLDCHSRPAHQFVAPVNAVNAALNGGSLPSSLPEIKLQSVRVLDGDYDTTEEAMRSIEVGLRGFYQEEYPELVAGDGQRLADSVATVQAIYRKTIFPEMKADWSAHPNNIGHRDSPGCFRCHNDEMLNEDGDAIFTDCSRCHAILVQGKDVVQASTDFERGQDFIHPEDSDTVDEFTLCSDCHTGGAELYEE
jgi:hypothetical protein